MVAALHNTFDLTYFSVQSLLNTPPVGMEPKSKSKSRSSKIHHQAMNAKQQRPLKHEHAEKQVSTSSRQNHTAIVIQPTIINITTPQEIINLTSFPQQMIYQFYFKGL